MKESSTSKRGRTGGGKALSAVAAAAGLAAVVVWGDRARTVSRHTLRCPRLPRGFDGLRLAHLSDLHGRDFGRDNAPLISALRRARPDLILFTGDLIDSRRGGGAVALSLVEQAARIAPVYAVTGNHEGRLGRRFDPLEAAMAAAGARFLHGEAVTLRRGGARLRLMGIDDAARSGQPPDLALAALPPRDDTFTLLLAHRPWRFEVYAAAADLTLCGHTHGGQFRLPRLGGLYAPGQGLLPPYDGGLYRRGEALLLVSRGLGNSLFPLRLGNRPELVLLTLRVDGSGARDGG